MVQREQSGLQMPCQIKNYQREMNMRGMSVLILVEPIDIGVIKFCRVDKVLGRYGASTCSIEPPETRSSAFITDLRRRNAAPYLRHSSMVEKCEQGLPRSNEHLNPAKLKTTI